MVVGVSDRTADWHPLSGEARSDPVAAQRVARERCPVAWTEDLGGFWSVLRYDDVVAVARDTLTFSNALRPRMGRPRQPLNPITAASFGLGYVLRLWRNASPLVEGGTVVLLHPFSRVMGTRAQAPYRTLFAALRDGTAGARLGGAEAVAARDRRALSAYRGGNAPHPRLPFRSAGHSRVRIQHR